MHRPPRTARIAEGALSVLLGITSLGATCVPNPNDRPPGDMGPDTPVGVGFAEIEADVKKSCLTSAAGCHSPATMNQLKIGDDRMANYQVVKMFIAAATPEQAPLLLKALGMGTPVHGGGPVFMGTSDASYQRWLKWIKDGAIFDPTVKRVTYADIEMDMTKSCGAAIAPCHGAAATTNKLKLGADRAANYQLVKAMFLDLATPAESPLLKKSLGQLNHTGGAVFMAGDATYKKWLDWVTAGAPEK